MNSKKKGEKIGSQKIFWPVGELFPLKTGVKSCRKGRERSGLGLAGGAVMNDRNTASVYQVLYEERSSDNNIGLRASRLAEALGKGSSPGGDFC